MENISSLFSSSPFGRESTFIISSVAVNPDLVAGVLLGSVLLGLASYSWAFWLQRSRLKALKDAFILSFTCQPGSLRGAQIIYDWSLALLFNDIVNAITSVILAVELLRSNCNSGVNCAITFIVWFVLRCYGVVLHLLNALICLLFLCNPQWRDKLRCVYTWVFLLTFVFVVLHFFVSLVSIFGLLAINTGLALAIIAKFTMSTPSANAQKKPIVLVAMLTFLFVYIPTFILQCLSFIAASSADYVPVYVTVLFCTNFILLMDGLLCYCILKLPSEEEEQQEQQQHQSSGIINYAISADVIS